MPELYEIAVAPPTSLDASRITQLPILLLNVHSQCNCRCVMCDIWKRKDGREFPAADLERHKESMRSLGVKHVVMTGGEPLLHRELGALCDFFRQLNVRTTLLTTGLLLEKKADVVASGFDEIILSIDGPEELHDRIRRVPRAFEAIKRGVLAVRERRLSMPISCRTTVQRLNRAHLCETVSAAKSLGLDSISFLAADVYSEAFNREQAWTYERQAEVSLNGDEVEELTDEIERLVQIHRFDIDSGFIVERDEKLRLIGARFCERIDGLPPKAPLCNAPWVSAVIEVDGRIRPCFFHPPVADMRLHSLEAAINSPAAMSFRGKLDVESNPICKRCVCSLNYQQQSSF